MESLNKIYEEKIENLFTEDQWVAAKHEKDTFTKESVFNAFFNDTAAVENLFRQNLSTSRPGETEMIKRIQQSVMPLLKEYKADKILNERRKQKGWKDGEEGSKEDVKMLKFYKELNKSGYGELQKSDVWSHFSNIYDKEESPYEFDTKIKVMLEDKLIKKKLDELKQKSKGSTSSDKKSLEERLSLAAHNLKDVYFQKEATFKDLTTTYESAQALLKGLTDFKSGHKNEKFTITGIEEYINTYRISAETKVKEIIADKQDFYFNIPEEIKKKIEKQKELTSELIANLQNVTKDITGSAHAEKSSHEHESEGNDAAIEHEPEPEGNDAARGPEPEPEGNDEARGPEPEPEGPEGQGNDADAYSLFQEAARQGGPEELNQLSALLSSQAGGGILSKIDEAIFSSPKTFKITIKRKLDSTNQEDKKLLEINLSKIEGLIKERKIEEIVRLVSAYNISRCKDENQSTCTEKLEFDDLDDLILLNQRINIKLGKIGTQGAQGNATANVMGDSINEGNQAILDRQKKADEEAKAQDAIGTNITEDTKKPTGEVNVDAPTPSGTYQPPHVDTGHVDTGHVDTGHVDTGHVEGSPDAYEMHSESGEKLEDQVDELKTKDIEKEVEQEKVEMGIVDTETPVDFFSEEMIELSEKELDELIREKIKQKYKIEILKKRLMEYVQMEPDRLFQENQEYKEKVQELEQKLFEVLEQVVNNSKNKFRGDINLKRLNIKLINYVKDIRKDTSDIDLYDLDRHLDLLDLIVQENDEISNKKPNKNNNNNKKGKKPKKKSKDKPKKKSKDKPKKKSKDKKGGKETFY